MDPQDQSNFEFIEEEDFFAKDCSIELYKLIEDTLNSFGPPKRGKTLFDWLWHIFSFEANPIHITIKRLNLPEDTERYFDWFYDFRVYSVMTKLVALKKINKKLSLVFTNSGNHSIDIALFTDKEKVLQLVQKYIKICIKNAFTDKYNLENRMKVQNLREIYKWREQRMSMQQLENRIPELKGIF